MMTKFVDHSYDTAFLGHRLGRHARSAVGDLLGIPSLGLDAP